jgi:cytochrome P450
LPNGTLGDVVDAVLNATVNGRPSLEDEIIGTVQLLILGGLETTAGSPGLMVVRFCREPGFPRCCAPSRT